MNNGKLTINQQYQFTGVSNFIFLNLVLFNQIDEYLFHLQNKISKYKFKEDEPVFYAIAKLYN